MPDATDGDKPIPGAFTISPSKVMLPAHRMSLTAASSPDGKNTTLAWASAKDDGWKPTLKAPGLDEQTYQIMCDAIDLPAAQLGNQMYLGEITCI
jgi:hypothetical protein